MNQIEVMSVTSDEAFDILFDIRRIVFQEEQQVPEETEVDGNDHIAHHFLAILDGKACGTARWRITPSGRIKLERFAVLRDFRGKGIGQALVKYILSGLNPKSEIYLHAQENVIPFYEKLGFCTIGDFFEEGGIQHKRMEYSGS